MGVFNALLVRCPECNTEHELQTKPGDMTRHTFGEYPLYDQTFVGDQFSCCGSDFEIEFETPPIMPKLVVRKTE